MIVDVRTLGRADQHAMFFRNPQEEPERPDTVGSLYLLRRDVNDMRRDMPNAALWPRAMVILAGIDLLAKFYTQNDSNGGVSERFREFVGRFITTDGTTSRNTWALFHLRNSLLHSFGWYSKGQGNKYRFTLARDSNAWLVQQDQTDSESWVANLTELEIRFERSITQYEALINSPSEQESFSTDMFLKYGWSNIG